MTDVIAVGTDKGAWILRPDESPGDPLFPGWRVTAWGRAADGTALAGTASGWFGPGIHTSSDLAEWTAIDDGPAYAEDGPDLEQIWTFTTAPDGRIWCGVAQAGLFTSEDHGRSWSSVEAFNTHPTRDAWMPGAGGMCAHRVLLAGDRIVAGVSSVGVFRSDDGGQSFATRNDGLESTVPGGEDGRPEVGYCVHAMVGDPDDPDRLWQQNHTGVYRSTDGAVSWQRTEDGLPSRFGFPIVRDHASGALFVVPLSADVDRTPPDGRLRVYRSSDDGDSWQVSGVGMPEEPSYDCVLRGALAADGGGRIALGTTGGQVWLSEDAGDTWRQLPGTFPRINAVSFL